MALEGWSKDAREAHMNRFRRVSPITFRLRLAVAPALALVALACAASDTDTRSITQAELTSRIDAGKAPLILDVRTREEYAAGHVSGARNIPFDELSSRLGELPVDKDEEVVVYCRSGGRAAKAEGVLIDAGFSNVRNLDGHMQGWSTSGHPVEQ
jgi:phage shock protein E